MEVTTSDRFASGGPGADMVAPNLAKAFQSTAERLGDEVAVIAGESTITEPIVTDTRCESVSSDESTTLVTARIGAGCAGARAEKRPTATV